MQYDVNHKIVLITGGTSGIGLTTAKLFLKNAATVIIVGRDTDRGLAAAHSLMAFGQVHYMKGDVSKPSECENIIKQTVSQLGKLDILVNSAGIYQEKLLSEVTEAEYNNIMNTNIKGTYFMCKAALPELRKTEQSAIVNIASDAAINGNLLCTAYCASKGAIVAFTKALALEAAPYNIRANCVCPGDVATPLLDKQLAENNTCSLSEMERLYPLGRIAQAEEIAHVIVFLASPAASFVTGAIWSVDGGLTTC